MEQLSLSGGQSSVRLASLHAKHDDAIESFVLQWQDPQPLAAIGDWLHGLAANYGARLLRVKGIVGACGVPVGVAVHAIQHLVAAPDFLSSPAQGSRVVFITRGLEPGDVAPVWPFAVASAAPLRPAQGASRLFQQPLAGVSSGGAIPP